MPPTPKSGMAYKAPNPAEELKKARAASTPGSSVSSVAEDLPSVDFQEVQGNEFINDMIKGGQSEQSQQTALAALPLPAEVRWRLLASTDIQTLASLIYSQCTPAESVTKEMLAIGSVFFNRWEQTIAHPEDQKEFGAANFEGLLFQVQRMMPLAYHPDREGAFHHAARFGGELGTQSDVNTAVAAIQAAEQIYTGVNPFPDKYMYLDISGSSPNPDRTDFRTHVQYGKLHFWSLKTATANQSEQTGDQSATLVSSSAAAEPAV